MNWHKLRVGQLDAPTVRLIRKASRDRFYSCVKGGKHMVSAGFMLVCPCVCSRRARATSTLTVSLMTRQRQMRSSPVGTATSNNRGLRIKVEGLRIKGHRSCQIWIQITIFVRGLGSLLTFPKLSLITFAD